MQLFMYPPLDGDIIQQVRRRLSLTPFSTARVTSELKDNPWPDGGQVWLTPLPGVETEEGFEDNYWDVKVIAPDYDQANQLAVETSAIMRDIQAMGLLLDDFSPSEPIYSVVTNTTTTPPAPTSLYAEEGQTTFNFTLIVHRTGDYTTR